MRKKSFADLEAPLRWGLLVASLVGGGALLALVGTQALSSNDLLDLVIYLTLAFLQSYAIGCALGAVPVQFGASRRRRTTTYALAALGLVIAAGLDGCIVFGVLLLQRLGTPMAILSVIAAFASLGIPPAVGVAIAVWRETRYPGSSEETGRGLR